MFHLWVTLTPHGFGHAAMTAPVVRLLRQRHPDMRLTIQSGGLPLDFLYDRFGSPFNVIEETTDFGLIMESATQVKVQETVAAYQRLHDALPDVIAKESARLAAAAPDLVLSNVSYVGIAAAAACGIPAVALCSLNWADLYWHYCADSPQAAAVHEQILDCYRKARLFLRPDPSMPMPNLETHRIGPIAFVGKERRQELHHLLSLSGTEKIGLIAFGGMLMDIDMTRWPHLPGWRWLIDGRQVGKIERPDMRVWQEIDIPLIDLVRSSDLIVSKPGYNTFSEAGVNGIPLLWVERPGWPENVYLDDWLKSHGKCGTIKTHDLFDSRAFSEAVAALTRQTAPPVPLPTGAQEASDLLEKVLTGER